jgi:hypothetical protein
METSVWSKIWAYLAGNKTIICMGSVAVIQKLIELKMLENTNVVQFVTWILVALGTGALIQHVKNGYFTTEKGQ